MAEPTDRNDAEGEQNVSTGSNDVNDIRREMARVRRELHSDVQSVVSTAEAAVDWRHYITAYPWLTLGVATVVGYMVVPRLQKTVTTTLGTATEADLAKIREAVSQTQKDVADSMKSGVRSKPSKGLIGAALGIVTPIALRTAQGYAMKYLESWILQQQMSHPVTGSLHVPSGVTPERGPSRTPRTGGVSP